MEEKQAYHCGVIDAFNEAVASGVKKLALSHPFDSTDERRKVLPFVDEICAKYHTMYYLEDRLLISDLFPANANQGKAMILFFKEQEVLEEYLLLKRVKAEAIHRHEYASVRLAIAHRFGALLSYSQQRIEELIQNNDDKETWS